MASRAQGELQEALRLGGRLGLKASDIKKAERVLAEEERKVAARRRLKDAVLKKSTGLREQLGALRLALEEAREAGVPPAELQLSEEALQFEERQAGARELLEKARQSQRFDDCQQALQEAEAAGLSGAELAEGRALLEESRKPAARERLRAAVAARDREELRAAIAHGQAVGITPVGLAEARKTLAEEERKVEARARLDRLVEEGRGAPAAGVKVGELRAAIKFGEVLGLLEAELTPARSLASSEEQKIQARARLAKAERSLDAKELGAAVAEGVAAGLTAGEMQAVRRALDEVLKAETRSALATAVACRQVAALKAALRSGEAAGLGPEELEEAQGLLAAEERKVHARAGLEGALKANQAEELRAAVAEGEAAGLIYAELRAPRAALDVLLQRAAAWQAVQAALVEPPPGGSRDLEQLRVAMKMGASASLPLHKLGRLDELIVKEQAKAAARAALAAAERAGAARELQAALRAGEAAGLSPRELGGARGALAAAQAAAARAALARAGASRGLEELRRAVTAGEAAGLGAGELSAPRRLLAEEHLKVAHRSRALHELQAAVSYGAAWLPEAPELGAARAALGREERKAAARAALKEAEEGGGCEALLAALRAGHLAGLEEWELGHARKALTVRRLAAASAAIR